MDLSPVWSILSITIILFISKRKIKGEGQRKRKGREEKKGGKREKERERWREEYQTSVLFFILLWISKIYCLNKLGYMGFTIQLTLVIFVILTLYNVIKTKKP